MVVAAIKSDSIQPIRFMRRCKAAGPLAQKFARDVGRGGASGEQFNRLAEGVMVAYKHALNDLPVEQRPSNMDVLTGTLNLIGHLGHFVAHGRNIFALDRDLVELLRKTELSGVRTADVHLPFGVFYVSFGEAFSESLPGEQNHVDGVYVNSTIPGTLQLVVTCRRFDYAGKSWVLGHERYFYMPLKMSGDEQTFEAAISAAVAEHEIPLAPDLRAIEEQKGHVAQLQSEGLPVRAPVVSARERTAEFNRTGIEAARGAVALAVNAICYLTAAPDGTEPPAPCADTPPELMAATEDRRKAKRQEATARLLDGGWLPIRFVRAPTDLRRDEESPETGPMRSPHWRRGHWRRQPFGTGRSQIKLAWIRPTLVRGDLGEPAAAHAYDVTG